MRDTLSTGNATLSVGLLLRGMRMTMPSVTTPRRLRAGDIEHRVAWRLFSVPWRDACLPLCGASVLRGIVRLEHASLSCAHRRHRRTANFGGRDNRKALAFSFAAHHHGTSTSTRGRLCRHQMKRVCETSFALASRRCVV